MGKVLIPYEVVGKLWGLARRWQQRDITDEEYVNELCRICTEHMLRAVHEGSDS
jgi:hypothetical protein